MIAARPDEQIPAAIFELSWSAFCREPYWY
jgi:hypothetical protein